MLTSDQMASQDRSKFASDGKAESRERMLSPFSAEDWQFREKRTFRNSLTSRYRMLTTRRRPFFLALSSAFVLSLLLLGALSGGFGFHRPGPAPFYCSTWDSATSIPAQFWPGVIAEFRNWAKYDWNQGPRMESPPSIASVPLRPRAILDSYFRSAKDKPKSKAGSEWVKPKGFKVVAMIFFGRPHQVDIIDCYLQQNMKHNGGYLDEVHFIEHSTDQAALDWLRNLVAVSPGYKALQVAPHCQANPHAQDCRYERIWEHFATDENTLYIKIDDDVVYIHEEAIPRMVEKRLQNPHAYAISANIINSPMTSWLHYHRGAVYPYLPEPHPSPRPLGQNKRTWKASELPIHPDDASYHNFEWGPTPDTALINSAIESDAQLYRDFHLPPFPGHRWLPLSQNTTSILHTPASRETADPWGPSVHSWAIAAQQHYSLLQNIENKTLDRYYFAPLPPHGDGLWNMQYTRYNLNFIAVWGRDIVLGAKVRRVADTGAAHGGAVDSSTASKAQSYRLQSQMFDDEKNITVDIPRALGREMLIDTQALVAHMHFHDQEIGMQMTDLLDRWRAYVNERVCAPSRQKEVPGTLGGLGWTESNSGWGWWQCPWVNNV